MSPVPETLRQYALLADGERGALVGPRGDIAFLCAPRWHDDAVFSGLLGGLGHYVVQPVDDHNVPGGNYERGGLIWRSRWTFDARVLECREALAFPGDPDRVVLLRRLEAPRADARARIRMECRAAFGSEPMELRPAGDAMFVGRTGELHLRWTLTPGLTPVPDGDSWRLEVEVPHGRHLDLVLEISTRELEAGRPDPDALWAATEQAWKESAPPRPAPLAPRDAQHAWSVLRGLTSHTGAMVAAATTCLPEHAEKGRDYDYRYAWIRDQCFAGRAAARAGGGSILDASVAFVRERVLADRERLLPAYTVDGQPIDRPRPIDLPGYPGTDELCVGNAARDQFQLDVLGEVLQLFAAADRLGRLDGDGWKAALVAVETIERRHREPDAGIWELEPQRWAHSRLCCAGGLKALAERRPDDSRADDWRRLADHLVETTSRECLHPSGRWQRSPGDARVDAALVLPAIDGAVPPDDPRSVETLRAVLHDLTADGYVYRFRQDGEALGRAEGAFLLCGFQMALACHQQGDEYGALRWFERTRAAVGPAGLFTEEYDVQQRQLRGNLPQAFVHTLLLETAHTLAPPSGQGGESL